MALNFRRRLFRTPSKPMQYILAFCALLIVLALVVCWAIVHQNRDSMQSTSSDGDTSAMQQEAFDSNDKGNLLCVVADKRDARFYLIQSDPAKPAIYILPIPQQLTVAENKTLLALYREAGAIKTATTLAELLKLPLKHYLTITPDNAAKWLGRARDGIHITLENAVNYTDDSGQTTSIPSGKLTATASQASMLLHHSDETGSTVLAALLNSYMTAKRNLMADFSELCNRVSQTNLRIDNFTAYRNALVHLSETNSGDITTITILPTENKDDTLTVSHRDLKRLPLYD